MTMAALVVEKNKPSSHEPVLTTSVFSRGDYLFDHFLKDRPWFKPSPWFKPPPTPLFVVTPTSPGTYPVIMFLPGFVLRNTFYQQFFEHIASHGYIIVAPQLYGYNIWASGLDEIDSAAQVINWLPDNLKSLIESELKTKNVVPDFTKFGLSGHSRGGKAAFSLALGDGKPKPSLKFSVLIGVDPVAGRDQNSRIKPYILTNEPRSFNISIPVTVIGTGLGHEKKNYFMPPGAPDGLNHEEFFKECKPPCSHFVVKDYGHMDMLGDNIAGLAGWICKNGTGPRELMRRTVGGIVVASLNASLKGRDGDFAAIVNDPGLAPAKLDPVEFIPV